MPYPKAQIDTHERLFVGIGAATVTPSDTVEITPGTPYCIAYRRLWVGVAGNVSLMCVDGSTAAFTNVPNGVLDAVAFVRVNATGTTATSLVAIL